MMPEKVAIVHDWLVTDAGAEKVLRAIIDLYPDADIFSLVDFLDDKDRESVLAGEMPRPHLFKTFLLPKNISDTTWHFFLRLSSSLTSLGMILLSAVHGL